MSAAPLAKFIISDFQRLEAAGEEAYEVLHNNMTLLQSLGAKGDGHGLPFTQVSGFEVVEPGQHVKNPCSLGEQGRAGPLSECPGEGRTCKG
jgi:hypothetical protein